MNIKTIIFDLDGPILNGERRHYQCYKDILEKYQQSPLEFDFYWNIKRNREPLKNQLRYTNAETIYYNFKAEWIQKIEMQDYLQLDQLQPDIFSLLTELKNSNKRIILTTMRHHKANLLWQLKELKIHHFFDKVSVSNGLQEKFKTKKVKLALRDELADFFWIGDTEIDIQSAKALSIQVGAVLNGLRSETYLARLKPDYIGKNVTDIFQQLQQLSEHNSTSVMDKRL